MQTKDIPNLLCVLRMLLTIPVAWAILEGRFQLALLLFLVAGFTDGLDGFLAKHFAWQSRLGGLLDPAADKLLLASAFVTLWVVGHVPGWLLTAVIGRDLIIIAGALLYYQRVGPFEAEPTIISKLNSALQLLYILLTLCLLVFAVPGPGFLFGLAWLVLVTISFSGLDYVIRWSARARAARS